MTAQSLTKISLVGQSMSFMHTRRWLAIVIAVASFGAALVALPATAGAQPSTTIPGDGTYMVGVDIRPGTYVSSNPGYCSWYRLSSLTSDSIIDSGNTASGKQYVTIAPSDVAFKTLSCSTWTPVNAQTASTAAQPGTTIPGDGTFLVGVDVRPGTYVSSNPGYCSWYRLSSLSTDSIIDSGNTASGKQYVTIAPGDVAFKTLSCSTWSLMTSQQ
jgi:hypothetical protein